MDRRRGEWLSLVEELDRRIKGVAEWLERQARPDGRVARLRTHPGLGLPTSLALAHTLEPVARFGGGRKVAAHAGLDPMEYSSGEEQRFGSISKLDPSACFIDVAGIASRHEGITAAFDYAATPGPRRQPLCPVANL